MVWRGKRNGAFFSEAGRHTLDVLIALGGDGTIRRAAQQCAETTAFLIPLPGGTENMLPRALYGEVSWEHALKNTLATPSAKMLSGGNAMGRAFFVAAIIGAPALWTKPREFIREGNIVDAVEKGQRRLPTHVRKDAVSHFGRNNGPS